MEQSLFSIPKQVFLALNSFQYRKPHFRRSKRVIRSLIFTTLCCILPLSIDSCWADLSNDRFGSINIYKSADEPVGVVILFSGQSGFDSKLEAVAREISENGLLVIGVNSARYLEGIKAEDKDEDCTYLSGEITRLSQAAQSTQKLNSYKKPVLMGVESGAALAFVVAAQYPNEFTGLVTVGFCPSIKISPKFCDAEGLKSSFKSEEQVFSQKTKMHLSWRDYSPSSNPFCAVGGREKFLSSKKDQKVINLTQEQSSLELGSTWFVQLIESLKNFSKEDEDTDNGLEEAVSDLPLIELFPSKRSQNSLIFIVSGDGGWATIDKDLGEYFLNQGYAVLGFDALSYFWKQKSTKQTAADINRALRFYRTKLGIDHLVLVGYSLGADVLPFVLNRLEQDNFTDVSLATFLSPGKTTDFEIHVADWLGIEGEESVFNVPNEIKKIKKLKLLCIYGSEDEDQTCTALNAKRVLQSKMPGDHHFDGDYEGVAKIISDAIPK